MAELSSRLTIPPVFFTSFVLMIRDFRPTKPPIPKFARKIGSSRATEPADPDGTGSGFQPRQKGSDQTNARTTSLWTRSAIRGASWRGPGRGFVLVSTHVKAAWVVGAIVSGASLFVLTA